MKVNATKYACKNFVKKSCPERISDSVRIKGIRGSEKQREDLALDLNNKFFSIISDAFREKLKTRQKPILQASDIKQAIKKVLPKASIDVICEKNLDCVGYTEPQLNIKQRKFTGITLYLKSGVRRGLDEATLRHEMLHVFDYLTQPKTLARNNGSCLVGKIKSYTDNKDLEHFNFYDKVIYAPKKFKEDKIETECLKTRIESHFKKLNSSSEEKIEILQNWRCRLKSEVRAYSDEAPLANKNNPKQYIQETVGYLFMEPKIKLLEKMLKDEIASVRNLNAQKWGVKQ